MLSRNLEKARSAYDEKDVQASVKAHSGKKRVHEFHKVGQGQYIKSVVYGGLDGVVTTFAIVAGVVGADLKSGIILILGFANLFADGLSMAVGDYLSSKAEQEFIKAERTREEWEMENHPEGEKQEMIELYNSKGYSIEDATQIVTLMLKNEKAFVDTMMVEELGLLEETESPIKNALATFFSFAIFGFVPLFIYLITMIIPQLASNTFLLASILTGLTLFSLGALKTRFTDKSWFKSGMEMLIVGGLAAAAAYFIGHFAKLIFGIEI